LDRGNKINKFSNILFVTSENKNDSAAFNQAVTLATNNQAQMVAVGTVNTPSLDIESGPDVGMLNLMIDQRRKQLQKLVQGIEISGSNIVYKVLIGRAFIEIIREVLRQKRDLVIKSVENSNAIKRYLYGSTDMKLLRNCPCPVWLIKSTQQKGHREILVALDYQPQNAENEALNQQLLESSVSLALADFSELHVVHVWKLPYESYLRGPHTPYSDTEVDEMVQEEEISRTRWLSDLVETICEVQGKECANYLKPQLHLIQGDAKKIVPKYAKQLGAELVVMGTVGRTGVPGFLIGNTAESILNQLDCSVLALKPEGFVSPITVDN